MEEDDQPLLVESRDSPNPSPYNHQDARRGARKGASSTFLVVLALVFIQTSLGLYVVLTKEALKTGMDAGTFVLLRDTITAAVLLVISRIYLSRANRTQPAAEQLSDMAADETTPHPSASFPDYSKLWLLPAPEHRLSFVILGVLGVYFGQYVALLGLQSGTTVLAATFNTATPFATFLLGLFLGTEPNACQKAQVLKVCGVILAVAGAVLAIVPGIFPDGNNGGGNSSNSFIPTTAPNVDFGAQEQTNNPVRAGVFFTLQMILGGACFWHLQKHMLGHGYSSIQTASWYYGFGAVSLCLAVAPSVSQSSTWQHLEPIDAAVLGLCVVLYPLLCILWTWANKHSSPTFVMAFSPLQIGMTGLFDFILYHHIPSVGELIGGALVVTGIVFLILGQIFLHK